MTVDAKCQGARVICEGVAPVTTELVDLNTLDWIFGKLTIHSLVFVHGLNGHPIKTWSATAASAIDEKKKRSLSEIFRRRKKQPSSAAAAASEKDSVFWPRDILAKDVPNCRIITYGYESNPHQMFAAANKNNILGHAKNMLAEIQRNRVHVCRHICKSEQSLTCSRIQSARSSSYAIAWGVYW
jgi:hypothetical protein